ncbi:MAG: SIS domain-containing protein, partial [Proteobacteria bacterium]|nr:SIS domain-containing protein [Pseudomonadota bacterium]
DNISQKKIREFFNILLDAYQKERQVFVMGNGGSASTASHFACDINKGVSQNFKKKFKVICLNDNIPTMMAYANDVGYDVIFKESLSNFLKTDDIVIGISGSGNSTNVLNAIAYANEKSAVTVGISGFGGGKLLDIAQKHILIPSDDMQIVEDLHMIIVHLAMKWLSKSLKNNGDN